MKENESNLETQLCWEITVFDKKEFVESVIERGLSRYEIAKEALTEVDRIESRSIRAEGSSDHVRFLRSLMLFLIIEVKVRPANLSDKAKYREDEFQILLPLAQHLVDRGDLSPDVLELFGE